MDIRMAMYMYKAVVCLLAVSLSLVNAGCQFQRFPDTALYGFNDKVIKNLGRWECERRCEEETDFSCESFDHIPMTSTCFLSSESRGSQQQAYGKHSKSDYYERVCDDDEDGSGEGSGETVQSCREEWKTFAESCYLFVTNRDLTRPDAQVKCAQYNGGHLVAIETEAEFEFVTSAILKAVPGSTFELFWTSGRRSTGGQSWEWELDGGKSHPMRYINWYSGEPNNSQGREDVVNIFYNSGTWGFNDGYAMDKLRYACEAPRAI